jgi:hypothetical protein
MPQFESVNFPPPSLDLRSPPRCPACRCPLQRPQPGIDRLDDIRHHQSSHRPLHRESHAALEKGLCLVIKGSGFGEVARYVDVDKLSTAARPRLSQPDFRFRLPGSFFSEPDHSCRPAAKWQGRDPAPHVRRRRNGGKVDAKRLLYQWTAPRPFASPGLQCSPMLAFLFYSAPNAFSPGRYAGFDGFVLA